MKLVCTVGAGKKPYEETAYHFGAAEKWTNLAPIAIGCCAVAKDLELVALLTDEAEAMYGGQLRTEAEEEGWSYTSVKIPKGESEDELWEIFDAIGSQLDKGDEIVLDLTHGFRHIPALLLSAAQFYAIHKNLSLLGIFYGAWEARNENNESPIFDLTPLYDLSEWAYGVRLLRDYKFSAPLGKKLAEVQSRSHKNPRYQHDTFTRLQNVGKSLQKLESPLVSGIPLEAGFEAHKALEKVRSGQQEIKRIPPMKESWQELIEELQSFALQGSGGKRDISLTLDELERQSRLIEGYLKSGNLWAAANLLREWMISAIIFHSGSPENWLSYGKRRKPVEMKLGALSDWNKEAGLKDALDEQQRQMLALWKSVSDRRNALAHAGMKEEMTNFDPDTLRRPFEELKAKLDDRNFWSVKTANRTGKVWLISPLGTTPGAVFTAIKKANPDQLLVITSEQGKGLISEILQEAGREDLSPHFALLDDPFNGFSEVGVLARRLREEHGLDWIRAEKIVVNLTGGTTCLGWTVGRIGEALERMSRKPRTVACIDRRSLDEQRRDPYREGEMQDVEPDEER